MVIQPTLQQELELEKNIRSLTGSTDATELKSLCIALLRQNSLQQQLLRQAVGHIAKVEMEALLSAPRERPGFAERLFAWFRKSLRP